MNEPYDSIEKATEELSGEAYYKSDVVYDAVNASFSTYVAATKIILDQAHDLISHYASSLGKPEYYDIERDEWKIGHDWDFTDSNGICFYARVNVGQYRDPEYRERLVTLPWHILEAYMKDPANTKLNLVCNYQENKLKVQQEEERKATKYKADQEIAARLREIAEYKKLKEKYGDVS